MMKMIVDEPLDASDPFDNMCIDRGCATKQDVMNLSDGEWTELFVDAVQSGAIGGAFDIRSIWMAFDAGHGVESLFGVNPATGEIGPWRDS